MSCAQIGQPDGWIGNGMVDPGKGKGVVQPTMDPKGRRDLFDVIHCRNPGAGLIHRS